MWGGRIGAGVDVRVPLEPSSASCSPPATCNANENSLFFLSLSIFFLKQLGCLREVFTLIAYPGHLQGRFSPRDLIFSSLFFLTSLGRLKRGFQPNDGTQAPHGGFHLSPYFFISLFSFSLVSG